MNQAATTTALTASAAVPVFGQSLVLTAAVNSSNAPAVARTGSVEFLDNGVALQTVPLNATTNSASYTFTVASTGSQSYQALYLGDSNFKTSNSSLLKRTVAKDKTSIAWVSPPTSPINVNFSFNLNVQVAVLAPGASTLTGDLVTIKDNGKAIGTLTLDGSGDATLTGLNYTAVGVHSLTAIYAGDPDALTVTSSVLKLTVT